MNITQAVNYLKNVYPHPNFMVLCLAYKKLYLLNWLGAEKGNFRYGFQPIEKTAFYELGIGDSGTTENALKDYLNECLRRGYELYCAHSFAQLLTDANQLKNGVYSTLEPITKDEPEKKFIRVRLKEGIIVEGEII